jgi:DedD protein
MQPNLSNRNANSNLIKSSTAAGKKARRRLIGSIFMLLVALIILLNVTAKTKPIPVSPKVIEIKRNASYIAAAAHKNASATSALSASAPVNNKQISSEVAVGSAPNSQANASHVINGSSVAASAPIKLVTGQANVTESNNQAESTPATPKLDITPKLITETTKSSLSPEDILNGKTNSTPSTTYFIQLIAVKDKKNITDIKTTLTTKGVKSFIQPIKTDNGIIYRLRVGPFKNKFLADKRLAEIEELI